jgi:endonuclease YncB( thermonuclease family)
MGFTRFLLAIVLWVTANFAWAEVLVGRTVGVADGDTVTLLDAERQQQKIRLAGIDAPARKQAFGQVAKQKLSDLVYYKDVAVEWSKADKYRRKVGKVLLRPPYCPGSGCPYVFDANLEMISAGLAWRYKQYQGEHSEEDRERYAAAEEAAQSRKAGLWHDTEPSPHWERRTKTISA